MLDFYNFIKIKGFGKFKTAGVLINWIPKEKHGAEKGHVEGIGNCNKLY